jgi:hypothetical protein
MTMIATQSLASELADLPGADAFNSSRPTSLRTSPTTAGAEGQRQWFPGTTDRNASVLTPKQATSLAPLSKERDVASRSASEGAKYDDTEITNSNGTYFTC